LLLFRSWWVEAGDAAAHLVALPSSRAFGSAQTPQERTNMAAPTALSAPRGRVTEYTCCTKQLFTSDGSGSYSYVPITPPLEGIGPNIESLVVHLDCKELEAPLAFKVMIDFSFDGFEWTQGNSILPEQTSDGYYISSEFSTVANLGRFIRISLGLDDSGAAKSARFSVLTYFKFLSR
jgi:hypothetical protein